MLRPAGPHGKLTAPRELGRRGEEAPPAGYGRVITSLNGVLTSVMDEKAAPREALDRAAREVQQILDETWA